MANEKPDNNFYQDIVRELIRSHHHIRELQQQNNTKDETIRKLKEQLKTYQSDNNSLGTAFNSAKDKCEQYREKIMKLKESDVALQGEVKRLKKKYGDSARQLVGFEEEVAYLNALYHFEAEQHQESQQRVRELEMQLGAEEDPPVEVEEGNEEMEEDPEEGDVQDH